MRVRNYFLKIPTPWERTFTVRSASNLRSSVKLQHFAVWILFTSGNNLEFSNSGCHTRVSGKGRKVPTGYDYQTLKFWQAPRCEMHATVQMRYGCSTFLSEHWIWSLTPLSLAPDSPVYVSPYNHVWYSSNLQAWAVAASVVFPPGGDLRKPRRGSEDTGSKINRTKFADPCCCFFPSIIWRDGEVTAAATGAGWDSEFRTNSLCSLSEDETRKCEPICHRLQWFLYLTSELCGNVADWVIIGHR